MSAKDGVKNRNNNPKAIRQNVTKIDEGNVFNKDFARLQKSLKADIFHHRFVKNVIVAQISNLVKVDTTDFIDARGQASLSACVN